ncbi:MAG TPA: hypothetical protein VGM19_03790 [Armatimonadota bacterium]
MGQALTELTGKLVVDAREKAKESLEILMALTDEAARARAEFEVAGADMWVLIPLESTSASEARQYALATEPDVENMDFLSAVSVRDRCWTLNSSVASEVNTALETAYNWYHDVNSEFGDMEANAHRQAEEAIAQARLTLEQETRNAEGKYTTGTITGSDLGASAGLGCGIGIVMIIIGMAVKAVGKSDLFMGLGLGLWLILPALVLIWRRMSSAMALSARRSTIAQAQDRHDTTVTVALAQEKRSLGSIKTKKEHALGVWKTMLGVGDRMDAIKARPGFGEAAAPG